MAKNGFLFDAGSAEDLSAKIAQILDLNPDEYQQIANAAHQRVCTQFNQATMHDQTWNFYLSF